MTKIVSKKHKDNAPQFKGTLISAKGIFAGHITCQSAKMAKEVCTGPFTYSHEFEHNERGEITRIHATKVVYND